MSKKNNMSIEERVGDTSGFEEQKTDKKVKLIKIIVGCCGIAVLLVICFIFFRTPTKIEFKYQDKTRQSERYSIDKSTGLLIDAPKDPTKKYFDFGGWYLSSDYRGVALFNNETDKSLLEYEFPNKIGGALYAKWTPTKYNITYDVVGRGEYKANIGEYLTSILETQNSSLNLNYYTFSYELEEYDRNVYVEYLRETDPERYVNSKDAEKNLRDALELYANESMKSEISLYGLTLNGYTFLGWEDESGNLIEKLNKREPSDLVLYARWQKN